MLVDTVQDAVRLQKVMQSKARELMNLKGPAVSGGSLERLSQDSDSEDVDSERGKQRKSKKVSPGGAGRGRPAGAVSESLLKRRLKLLLRTLIGYVVSTCRLLYIICLLEDVALVLFAC